MSRAARTLSLFGIYLVALGAALIVAPALVLGWFGLPPAEEPWLRIVGMLAAFIGIYYRVAAAAEARPIFLASVALRVGAAAFFLGFYLAALAPAQLLIFGVVDLLGAAWTWSAFKRDSAA